MKKKEIISKHQMMAITNAVTGEMETAKVSVYVERDRPRYKGEPFTMLFQSVNAVMVRKMKPVTCRLMLYLCCVSEYGNFIEVTMATLAEDLEYNPRQVQRAMRELKDFNIIQTMPNPKDKRMTIITLNPRQSWKGKVKDRSKAIQKLSSINQLVLPLFDDDKKVKAWIS
jgi:hypothetical protein